MQIHAEFFPLDRVSGNRIAVRLCSADDARITAFSGQRWWPGILRRPSLNMTLFEGDFTGQIATGAGSMTISAFAVSKANAAAASFAWNAAPVNIWTINPATLARVLVFTGMVERITHSAGVITVDLRVDTEPFVQNALTLTYAGTGGVEGPADLKDKIKPLLLGRCFNVEPALIDAIDNVYQVSAYGPIESVETVYERGSAFTASFGDYADYAALVAAPIPNGRWATCLAQGLIRLAAPAYGVITADVRGDKPGGTWLRKPGEIINRLCGIASVPGYAINSASLAALDTALAGLPNQGRMGIYLTSQIRLLELIQQIARPCNAAAGISWLGELFVSRTVIGAPAAVLDAQARRLPPVVAVSEQSVSPPYWRIETQGARSWRVHSESEIAQGFLPADEVTYDDGTPVQDLQPAAPGADRTRETVPDLPTGEHQIGRNYLKGQTAFQNGSTFTARIDHLSSAANAPPNEIHWVLSGVAADQSKTIQVGLLINYPGFGTAGEMSVRAGPGGNVALSMSATVRSLVTSIDDLQVRFQMQRFNGSIWVDIGAFVDSVLLAPTDVSTVSFDRTVTGLTPGALVPFRLLQARIGPNDPDNVVTAGGTWTGAGS